MPLAHFGRDGQQNAVVLNEGAILNVHSDAQQWREMAIASYARAALAAMTKSEAQTWASQGIRINAVGPRVLTSGGMTEGACLTNEPDVAALAIYLASRRGRGLSGHVFDSDGVALRGH
jgi:3-oxoacyl-[acyl-carrier protein] reductase